MEKERESLYQSIWLSICYSCVWSVPPLDYLSLWGCGWTQSRKKHLQIWKHRLLASGWVEGDKERGDGEWQEERRVVEVEEKEIKREGRRGERKSRGKIEKEEERRRRRRRRKVKRNQ